MRSICLPVFFIVLLIGACCQPITERLCQTCPKQSTCLDGKCVCEIPGSVLMNETFCIAPGSFIAYFDDWYCMDTFAISLTLLPATGMPGTIASATVVAQTKRSGDIFSGSTQHSLFYLPLIDGDSIEIYDIPNSFGANFSDCVVPDGKCEINVFGKFRSPDTIDAVLKLHCRPVGVSVHGLEHKITFIKFK